MNNTIFKGMGVALVTPFRKNEEIDWEALEKLIDYQIEGKADFLVVMGTTSETPTINHKEREELIDFIRSKVNGRMPLVIGIGGNCTAELIEQLTSYDLSGYDAILSVVPFYNKPCQEGIYRHFKALSSHSPLPIILYNVPGRTGVNMDVATTLRLAMECDNIIGVKEASGNFRQIEEIIEKRPDGFLVLSGDDGITLPLMKFGADGVISVLGNVCPKEFGHMVHLCLDGRFDEATSIHDRFRELYHLLFVDGNPAGVKGALHAKGMIENILRLPLVAARPATIDALEKELAKF